MSAATDYLTEQVHEAEKFLPAVTFITCERSTAPPKTFSPAVASYGWGIAGHVVNNPNGHANGLTFNDVHQWFSDRVVNSQANAPEWQQFNAGAKDSIKMTFALDPTETDVVLSVVLSSWGNAEWTATANTLDEQSQQLLFNVPGAASGPPALMLASFAPADISGFL
jgi:hypothetical protein